MKDAFKNAMRPFVRFAGDVLESMSEPSVFFLVIVVAFLSALIIGTAMSPPQGGEMTEAIYFRMDDEEIRFEKTGDGVPRIGEKVKVRHCVVEGKGFNDRWMEGRVKDVSWYFSSGNDSKPVVYIELEGYQGRKK